VTSETTEAMYVATNLEHLFMPLYGVCALIRFYSANGASDGTPGGRLYYRLTPAVFVWIRSQLANAASRMAAGEIEREKYERAAERFKVIEIWATENIVAEIVEEAKANAGSEGMASDNGSPPAPGGQGDAANRSIPPVLSQVDTLPPYTEPDFGAFPAGPIGKARPAAEFALWSSVEKKWFRCLQPQEMQTKPKETKPCQQPQKMIRK
jgi:hypothetical protein